MWVFDLIFRLKKEIEVTKFETVIESVGLSKGVFIEDCQVQEINFKQIKYFNFQENYEVTLTRPDYDLGQWRIKIEVKFCFILNFLLKLFWVGWLFEFILWVWLYSNCGARRTEAKPEIL